MSNTKPGISTVPFAEPSYLRGLPSPYFQPTHLAFQRRCRAWFAEHFLPHALEWETAGTVPSHVWHTFNAANMLVPNLNSPLPVSWLHRLNIRDILGVPVQEWDYLHTAIWVDERARTGISGPGSSLSPGFAYGIPPILNFGSDALKEKFLPDLLTGKARTCIAITEPQAGSDVAGIQTTAVKSSDGKDYVINGEKVGCLLTPFTTALGIFTSFRGPKESCNSTKLVVCRGSARR
jgi:acyl-CoA dehydrogenase